MNFKIFGQKINLIQTVIVFLGLILVVHLLGGCCDIEGLRNMGADISYKMGDGVSTSWENKPQQKGSSLAHRSQDHDSYTSKLVTPDKSLNFFTDTEFSPDCCGSTYSANGGLRESGATSGGCACLSTEQINYINQRGGNRTIGGGDF
jgi:hypothetical protein